MSGPPDPRQQHVPLATVAAFHRASSRHSWERPETAVLPCDPREVPLPRPRLPDTTLSGCISGRLSCRQFAPGASISMQALSDLLYLAYGRLGAVETMHQVLETRPVPSASGLYTLEQLIFAQAVEGLPPAIYRYDPESETLRALAAIPDAQAVQQVFLDQSWVAEASAVIVMTGKPEAAVARYHERAYRFLLLECGHVGQNVMLGAGAMGLACCPVGGFEDYRLCCAAGLTAEQEWPLYALALGRPNPDSAADLRTPRGYEEL